LLCSSATAAEEQPKNILVINSYSPTFPATKQSLYGLQHILEPEDIEYNVFFLHSKKLSTQKHFDLFYTYIKNYIQQTTMPDLILTTDDNALLFMLQYGDKVFPNTPTVFCGVNNITRAVDAGKKKLFTGVAETTSLLDTIQLAIRLQPTLEYFYAISDGTESGKESQKDFDSLVKSINNIKFGTLSLQDLTFEELWQKLKFSRKHTAYILLSAYKDATGKTLSFKESLKYITKDVAAPIYHLWEHGIGQGLLGGRVISQKIQAEVAARMAVSILNGTSPEDIPVVLESPNRYILDRTKLDELHISKSTIPRNAILVGGTTPRIEQKIILITGSAFLFLFIVIILLAFNIIRRRHVEKKYKEIQNDLEEIIESRTTELQAMNDSLVTSMEKLQETQKHLVESEKMASLGELVAGVAHEINTPLGVGLTGVSFIQTRTENLQELLESETLSKSALNEFIKDLNELTESIEMNLKRAGELITSFRQVAVDQSFEEKHSFDLVSYLHKIFVSLKPSYKKAGHQIHMNIPIELKVNSYPGIFMQIFSNLVTNSLIHGFDEGRPGNIYLTMTYNKKIITMIYSDDGKGMSEEESHKVFNPFFTSKRGQGCTGLGMHIVYNLVTAKLGGSIECSTEGPKGVSFIIKIPFEAPVPPQQSEVYTKK
jgi:signal transduction histidine kinase